MYGQYQGGGRPESNAAGPSAARSETDPDPNDRPSERFRREYVAARANSTSDGSGNGAEPKVLFTGLLKRKDGSAETFEWFFNAGDWPREYDNGKAGCLTLYADDISNTYNHTFIENIIIRGERPPPGWFQYGVGPIGRIAYELDNVNGIDNFKKWEANFSEQARIYFTHHAPLSSDIFSIAEGLTGKSTDSAETFSIEERAEKVFSGLVGIATLATGSKADAIKSYVEGAVDMMIEKYIKGTELEEIKKAYDFYNDIKDSEELLKQYRDRKKIRK